jgi:hypothetical protein
MAGKSCACVAGFTSNASRQERNNMKQAHALAAICLLSSTSAHAALAPEWQRLAEFSKIVSSPELVDNFPNRAPVDRIERIADDLYRVTAGTCSMDIRIVDKPVRDDVAGPRRFELAYGKAACAGEASGEAQGE